VTQPTSIQNATKAIVIVAWKNIETRPISNVLKAIELGKIDTILKELKFSISAINWFQKNTEQILSKDK
jgi:hypothetical protein